MNGEVFHDHKGKKIKDPNQEKDLIRKRQQTGSNLFKTPKHLVEVEVRGGGGATPTETRIGLVKEGRDPFSHMSDALIGCLMQLHTQERSFKELMVLLSSPITTQAASRPAPPLMP